MQTSNQTLQDLEFLKIMEYVAQYAFTDSTKKELLNLKPYTNYDELRFNLTITNEYLTSIESGNTIPFSEFYVMNHFLELLSIENYVLPAEDFLKIKSNTLQIKVINKFISSLEEYYPTLYQLIQKTPFNKDIVKEIDTVFNKHGEIKDQASDELYQIRTQLKKLNGKIIEQFNKALTANLSSLDEIRESVIENRRVLAVKSAVRKQVKGRFLGTSKTGSISFIEPDNVQKTQREIDAFKEEESKEIIKILKSLTQKISTYKPILNNYQSFLETLDFTRAKAKFAHSINAVLPQISEKKIIELKDAYHPLLLIANKNSKEKTIPQSLTLNEEQRIIIISGPNAGGKSITLKTIGLNQLMIQSGLLIPVHPKSIIGFFDKIFTDIGDNQSIENHLSTYSYRLKQMQYFLQKANENSLLLIDEFGTGSDPELGGALAEVFFEEFYDKNAFGVFTTHYSNIKLTAEKLPQATNASMLFDKKTLTPMYLLEVGQAGSSFTFEVAEKNRIPFRLINRAKKKVEKDKVRLDKTILKLQQEKFNIQKTKNEVIELKTTSAQQNKNLESTQEKVQQKLYDFQQLYNQELKTLQVGKKMNELALQYQKSKNKKQLISQFLKWVEIENSKEKKLSPTERKKEKIIQKKLNHELKINNEKLKIQEQINNDKEKIATQQAIQKLKIGDRVKIKNSTSVGTIEKIEGQTIYINYGQFRTKISIFEVYKI